MLPEQSQSISLEKIVASDAGEFVSGISGLVPSTQVQVFFFVNIVFVDPKVPIMGNFLCLSDFENVFSFFFFFLTTIFGKLFLEIVLSSYIVKQLMVYIFTEG